MVHTTRVVGFLSMGIAFLAVGLLREADADAVGEAPERALARQILEVTGVQGGLVVHLGCGDGKLTAALLPQHGGGSFVVHGLDTDAAHIAAARKHISSLGLYGRVSVERWTEPGRLPYADNLVNLLVADHPEDLARVGLDEVMRVLAPRGVAYFKHGDGQWEKTVKPWPEDIDEWTHRLHDAGGNAVANDRVVGPPRHIQWTAGPLWARSHGWTPSTSAMVTARGRLFYILDETLIGVDGTVPSKWRLVARDAFSGVRLWEHAITHWDSHDFSGTPDNRGRFTMPPHVAKRLVAAGDTVYVTLSDTAPVSALDAASGRVKRVYAETAGADEVLYLNERLVVALNERPMEGQNPPEKKVCVVDAASGRMLWKKGPFAAVNATNSRDPYGRLELAAGDGQVFLLTEEAIESLDLDSGGRLWRTERPPLPASAARGVYASFGVYEYRLTVMVYHDGVVLLAQPEPEVVHTYHTVPGTLYAFDAKTGRRMWQHAYGAWGHDTPPDVFVVGDTVWTHVHAPAEFDADPKRGGRAWSPRNRGDIDYAIQGLDLRTGQLKKQFSTKEIFDVEHHHRCSRNHITERFLMSARRGVEFVDLDSGENDLNHWVRSGCLLGFLPANGLLYVAPHPCACYIEAKLSGFFALASEEKGGKSEIGNPKSETSSKSPSLQVPIPPDAAGGLEASTLTPERSTLNPQLSTLNASSDWPTYRHDGQRSGATEAVVGPELTLAWKADVGGRPSGLVVAEGKVLVANVDGHTVHAFDAHDGRPAWQYIAGARVDSPPTVCQGRAIFGSADGWARCLRTSDGAEVWRLRAAPDERRVMDRDQLESPWPVPGSVLVHQGTCWFAAGRSSYLDGGIRVWQVDPATGRVLHQETVYSPDPATGKMIKEADYKIPGLLNDVPATDGSGVFIRQMEISGAETSGRHLFTTAGYLDSSWFNRTFWHVGRFETTGVMVMGKDAAYGVEIYPSPSREMVFTPGGKGYRLICHSLSAAKAEKAPKTPKRRGGKSKDPASVWEERVPIRITALVLAGDKLLAAGSPDVVDPADPYAAWEGRKGGVLAVFDASDGKKLSETRLDAPPAWDGMAAVTGRVYVALTSGQVVCLAAKED